MAIKRDLLIGIDIGTSSTKAIACDAKGKGFASASRAYPCQMPKPGWSEQDPEVWWKAAAACLKSITKEIDPRRVAGVSFSGQMHGGVFLDAAGKPLRPAILWNDGRTAAQCAEIVDAVGRRELLDTVRNLPVTSYTLPKVLWLREHEKASWKKLSALLLPKDYVRYKLTGVKSMEESDGAGTLMMQIGRKRWAADLLAKLGINPSIMPPLTHSTDVVGRVTEAASRATGLAAGTLVVAGGGDQPVGAVGVGVFEEGQAMVALGTSGVVLAPTRQTFEGGDNGLASFDHAVPGSTYLMGCVLSAGGALRWHRDVVCTAETAEAKRRGIDPYDLMLKDAARIEPGAEGLLFLPYLMGERTPHADPNARAVWFGLSTRHTRAHMTRAVIEGVSFALRDCLDLIAQKGVAVKSIRATGGGARSGFWLQMLADVLEVPVVPIDNPEGGAAGAAIIAGVGVGIHKDFQAAADRAVRARSALKPRARQALVYRELHQRYRALYPALKSEFQTH